MRNLSAWVLLVAGAIATPAFAQSFVGEWTATATTPGGSGSERLTVVKVGAGYAITAKLIGAPAGTPEAGPGMDIVVDGEHFSYKRTLSTPGGTIVITYTGVVAGDTFTGTVDIGGFLSAPYTGVRIKQGGTT